MNAFPLNQLHTCADKQPLAMVSGTFGRVFKYQTGTKKQSGDKWSKQDFELKDEAGNVTKVVVWDKDELPGNLEGKKVDLIAKDGKSLTGLYVFDDTYQGNTTRKLKMTSTGIIQVHQNGGGAAQSQQYEPADQDGHGDPPSDYERDWDDPQHPDNQNRGTGQGGGQAPASNGGGPVAEAKRELMKLANLHVIAAKCVENYVAPKFKEVTGREMPEDRRAATTTSLVIAGERRGLHMELPNTSIQV